MKTISLCLVTLLFVCTAFAQTFAPSLTVASLIKVAYSFDDFETYLTKRGFKQDRTDSGSDYVSKSYKNKTKTTKADNYSTSYLAIYSNGYSTISYSPPK